jgi:hypothetical protein
MRAAVSEAASESPFLNEDIQALVEHALVAGAFLGNLLVVPPEETTLLS